MEEIGQQSHLTGGPIFRKISDREVLASAEPADVSTAAASDALLAAASLLNSGEVRYTKHWRFSQGRATSAVSGTMDPKLVTAVAEVEQLADQLTQAKNKARSGTFRPSFNPWAMTMANPSIRPTSR